MAGSSVLLLLVSPCCVWSSDGGGGAFFALRSCHQLLHADAGEFFSPDYLCSNPPLWCNWTIQVDPGKMVHLVLEDLTPDDACQLKKDQVHVEDPAGQRWGHKVLLKCWREAKFTSTSNTLEVVLLIGGWPSPPYRGFYGRYQAFGPPVVYNPQQGSPEGHGESVPSPGMVDRGESGPDENAEQMDPDLMLENSLTVEDADAEVSGRESNPRLHGDTPRPCEDEQSPP